ncbi:hypothetical protein RSO01_82160 [Reyranella soli]|uniref:TIGR03067 domain-containing protein n=1 Tax=Reyranella soli TaxID=1230389 RepID=A0A512NQ24_9HYPH|nr:hypothetical protein RSO01_82160 [Reyranella soli]
MRRTFLASSLVAFVLALSGVQAQTPPPTPIKSFAEVAGKWDGVGSSGTKVNFEISDKGVFAVSSPLGQNKGTATLENGLLVVPLISNQGYMRLSMSGGALEGTTMYQTRAGTIKFTRAK